MGSRGRSAVAVVFAAALLAFASSACSSKPNENPHEGAPTPKAENLKPLGTPLPTPESLGLPPVPVPADNPVTEDTVKLGQVLFFTTKLSKDGTISCASCHNPAKGFADPNPGSLGMGGQKGDRNAPSVQFAAYSPTQFWDGRAATLEEQALGPIANPIEMGHSLEGMEISLKADAQLTELFQKAFGAPPSQAGVAKALAAFERMLPRGNSPFDKFQYGHDPKALNESAKRGLAIFKDPKKGNCAVCHTIEAQYALFSDGKFHNLGVGMDENGELKDLGRYKVTKNDADRGAFKTPILRNVAQTAPYMHDGSQKTLKEVVDFYVGGGNSNPHLDKEIKPLTGLSKQDREDLVAFLESLTSERTRDKE